MVGEQVYIKLYQIHHAMLDRTFSKTIYTVQPFGRTQKVEKINDLYVTIKTRCPPKKTKQLWTCSKIGIQFW